MFSVFIDPCLLLDFAFSAHSDHCLSAADVTGEMQFMLHLFIDEGYGNRRSALDDFVCVPSESNAHTFKAYSRCQIECKVVAF